MKKILAVLIVLLILPAGFFTWRYFNDWTLRYHSELDQFFGKGNWRCVDSEEKESIFASKYVHTASSLGGETVPETYTDWMIAFQNRDGQEEIWRITNHSLIINHDRYGLFEMNRRLNGKQALTLELMDISFGVAAEENKEDVLLSVLSGAEASCFEVTISWEGGNPEPAFYDDLQQEPGLTPMK